MRKGNGKCAPSHQNPTENENDMRETEQETKVGAGNRSGAVTTTEDKLSLWTPNEIIPPS